MVEENKEYTDNNVSIKAKNHDLTRDEIQEHIDTGMRRVLVQLLESRLISIPEFKQCCIRNNLDYNIIEHCCGCAGCYDPEEGSQCPDYDIDHPMCQVMDPKYCNLCGKRAIMGYCLQDRDDEVQDIFWACEAHTDDPKLEKELRKGGYSSESIFKRLLK